MTFPGVSLLHSISWELGSLLWAVWSLFMPRDAPAGSLNGLKPHLCGYEGWLRIKERKYDPTSISFTEWALREWHYLRCGSCV